MDPFVFQRAGYRIHVNGNCTDPEIHFIFRKSRVCRCFCNRRNAACLGSRQLCIIRMGDNSGTFAENIGRYYITSETSTKAHWVQNIIHYPRVLIEISNNVFDATARIIDNEKEQELSNAIKELMKSKYAIGSIVEIEREIK